MSTIQKVLVSCVMVGLLFALVISQSDLAAQDKNQQVMLVLDYQDVTDWARNLGKSTDDVLNMARTYGIKDVALTELAISVQNNVVDGFFNTEVGVTAYLGDDLLDLQLVGSPDDPWLEAVGDHEINPDYVYLYVDSQTRGLELVAAASRKYGEERVNSWPVGEHQMVIELVNGPMYVINGLGFDPAVVAQLQQGGFSIVPRPINAAYVSEAALNDYFDYMRDQLQGSLIIFAGMDGVLGSSVGNSTDLMAVTAANLQQQADTKPLYGHVEMAVISGDTHLAQLLDYHLARVHSISQHEWQGRYDIAGNTVDIDYQIESAVERFLLAVNDRSVRVLYVRLFNRSLAVNDQYLSNLSQRLTDQGYQLGQVNALPIRASLSKISLFFIIVGIGAAALFLFLYLFPRADRLVAILLGLGIIGAGGVVFVMPGFTLLAQRLFALLAALVFPVLGILLAYAWRKTHEMTTWIKVMIPFIKALAVSFCGALYVHAILATAPFMTAIYAFPMVKIALLAPIPIVAVCLLIHDQSYQKLIRFLQMNVKVYHLVVAGVGLAILAVIAIRSGNNPLIPVSNLELELRLWFQKTLIARPRFKEFAVGYPLLILGAWLQYRRKDPIIVLTIGVIGLSSLVNTFAHLHKPLRMALLTTFNGIWSGLLVGIVVILGYELGVYVIHLLGRGMVRE